MSTTFFEKPILNSPYAYPSQHWELDETGQPTNRIVDRRRRAEFITPIPKPKKQKKGQAEIIFDEGRGLSTAQQQYETTSAVINELRAHVDRWRALPNPNHWNVTPETARLLQHWRSYDFTSVRPFFCQLEAVETAIWLTEVAPKLKEGKKFLGHVEAANSGANPGLSRVALKLATGAGKTTVMAMIIAWQTINAVRRPNSTRFTRGFLIVAPGLTIRDRLRVLQPNDPDSYYQSRELVPPDMLPDLGRAKIVITNYHVFKLREVMEISKLGDLRPSTLLFHLTQRLLYTKWRDPGEEPKLHLFGQLKRITREWLDAHLVCKGGTYPAQLMYQEIADLACEKITRGIVSSMSEERPIKAVLDPYNASGSTIHVNFNTSKKNRWQTRPDRSHVNWVILDSNWEGEFCRVVESHARVRAYVKNHSLGFEVPYQYGSVSRRYRPDFIVLIDDGRGDDDLLRVVVEIKGYRGEDAKEKKSTMETYWVPGVNNRGDFGRWAFAEFTDVWEIERHFNELVDGVIAPAAVTA